MSPNPASQPKKPRPLQGGIGRRALSRSTVDVGGGEGELPKAFRLFKAGANTSTKGTTFFTAESAAKVMAAYEQHGAELPLDLEHLSLDPDAPNFNTDAMAWFKLGLRTDANGEPELWAEEVRFNEEGARRLKGRLQRYISPAFYTDEAGNVTEVVNCALTSLPATDSLDPLIAASQTRNTTLLNAKQISKIGELLGLGAEAPVLEVFQEMGKMFKGLQDALSGKAPDPEPEAAPAEDPKVEEPAAAAKDPAADEEDDALKAASRQLLKLTAASSLTGAISTVTTWRTAYAELEAEKNKVAAERSKLEATERRELVIKLIHAGSETPVSAWSDAARTIPAKHLAAMSLPELRDRVAMFSANSKASKAIEPAANGAHGLTERQLRFCAESKADPAVFAANLARRSAAR